MKMKKYILLFSMLAVFFSLTACSSGQKDVSFEYTNTDIVADTVYQAYQMQNVSDAYRAYLADNDDPLAEVLLDGINDFDQASTDCGGFIGYRSKEDDGAITYDFTRLADTEDETAQDDFLTFVGLLDYDVEESGANVIVNVKSVYQDYDVDYSFVYEENPAYAYSYELTGQSVSPYQVKEIHANPEYGFPENITKADPGALAGIAVVCVILIVGIVLIVRKGNAKQTGGGEQTALANANDASGDLMQDAQLVAVITAAIAAATGATGGTDGLIVRSIRKAKRYR